RLPRLLYFTTRAGECWSWVEWLSSGTWKTTRRGTTDTSASKATALPGKKSKRCWRGVTRPRPEAGAAASLRRLAGRPAASTSRTLSSACPTTRWPFTPSRTTKSRGPGPEELIASGEAVNFALHGEYQELRPFVDEIKRAREAAGLTLAEVSRRCGIDQPALSRLENGHNKNPTLDTLWRYAAAVGRRLVLTTEAIRDTRPAQGKAKRVRAA